jgi:predicted nuclease with TOPRIM domain
MNIKAEHMLSILTAAETEMYETSKQKEDQGDLAEANAKLAQERDNLIREKLDLEGVVRQAMADLKRLEDENNRLTGETEAKNAAFDKERDITFKNQ